MRSMHLWESMSYLPTNTHKLKNVIEWFNRMYVFYAKFDLKCRAVRSTPQLLSHWAWIEMRSGTDISQNWLDIRSWLYLRKQPALGWARSSRAACSSNRYDSIAGPTAAMRPKRLSTRSSCAEDRGAMDSVLTQTSSLSSHTGLLSNSSQCPLQ